MMVEERYLVPLVFTHQQGLHAFWRAQHDDVERGGIYDAREAAIDVWSDLWTSWEQQDASSMVGTIHVAWHTPDAAYCTVYELEVGFGWTRENIERHVRRLFGVPVAGGAPGHHPDQRKRADQ